jgi:hypothetical protein
MAAGIVIPIRKEMLDEGHASPNYGLPKELLQHVLVQGLR